MRCIGNGAEDAMMFCGVMNLPPPPSKFSKYSLFLVLAAREACEESMTETVEENEGKRDLADDGSSQKRGFSSKNGLVTLTSVDIGKVLDVDIFSELCICPNKTNYHQKCKCNFEGYSGKMEVDGALSIFRCSESKYNIRHAQYLGDGDSKALNAIIERIV
ncbi:hypothetical protein AVEN_117246-1 [Araneus ventricosus]|uniref:Mutator-like transposase domain-containing protein n=1 Tax=Araneus ventricosus TaxID=182803 RepID=A0A4Y2AXN6_ARAVE|nr:hypothetical protein AVEN_117246-1 [Araneus ventricosus]